MYEPGPDKANDDISMRSVMSTISGEASSEAMEVGSMSSSTSQEQMDVGSIHSSEGMQVEPSPSCSNSASFLETVFKLPTVVRLMFTKKSSPGPSVASSSTPSTSVTATMHINSSSSTQPAVQATAQLGDGDSLCLEMKSTESSLKK